MSSGVAKPTLEYTAPRYVRGRHPLIDPRLLEILVCPSSKAPLVLSSDRTELWCPASGLAYPIRDGIPVLLIDAGRALSDQERENLAR